MTSPVQDFMSWTWEQMLQYVLNEGKDGSDGASGTLADRNLIGGPDAVWVKFLARWTETKYAQEPTIHVGDREMVGYRLLSYKPDQFAVDDIAPPVDYSERVYEIVRARIMFWDAPQEGAATPAGAFDTFHKAGAGALERLANDTNTYFRRRNFTDVALVLEDIETWLKRTDPILKELYDSIDRDSSGFQGSAAAVFAAALRNLREGIHRLSLDLNATSDDLAWSDRVRGKAGDMNAFREAIQAAWDRYQATTLRWHDAYNPGHLIDGIRQILAGMDQGNLHAITVDLSGEHGSLIGTFDLSTEDGWNQLNSHLKAAWMREVTALDTAMHAALDAMTTLFRDTEAALSHFGDPRYTEPDGTPGGDGDGRTGGGGGGGGADIDLSGLGLGGGGGGSGAGSDVDLSRLGLGGDGRGGAGNLDLSRLGGALGAAAGVRGSGLDLTGLERSLGSLGSGIGGLGNLGGTGGGSGGIDATGLGSGIASGLASGLRRGLGAAVGGSAAGGKGGAKPDFDDLAGGGLADQFPTPVDGVGIGDLSASRSAPPAGGSAVGGELAALLGGTGSDAATLAKAAAGTEPGGVLGGTGGYPFMPPMGGMGGMGQQQQGDRERERKTWLEEEEEVWGTDPDCAPAVLGRPGTPEPAPARGTRPAVPRHPAQPMGPARGGRAAG